MKKQYLIVGAGLAGLTLAYQLKKKGHLITLIDKGENHSSAIAAGMVNPMVFRRMNKSWRLDEFLPESVNFYQSLENELGVKFYQPIPIMRCFSSQQEKKWWVERKDQQDFKNYLHTFNEGAGENNLLHCENGSGIVAGAYWINTSYFIQEFQRYFRDDNSLQIKAFDATKLNPNEACYEGISYDGIIFCTGYAQSGLPFFKQLPIQQTKGQLMTICSSKLPKDISLNRKCFVLPIGNNLLKVGATYEWHNSTLHITPEGLHELKEKLACLVKGDFDVVKQEAGIRPTVSDRRPLLGKSAEFPQLFLYNGLGTKGYLMAPLLSKEMAELILEGKEPPMEYNTKRFSFN